MSADGHSLGAIAARVGGTLEGNAETVIRGVAPIQVAPGDHLAFLDAGGKEELLAQSRAGGVLVQRGATLEGVAPDGVGLIFVDNVRLALAQAMELFRDDADPWGSGVDPTAIVAEGVSLGEGVSVGPGVILGRGVILGDRTTVHAGTVIYPGVRVGADCCIQARCVLREGTIVGDRVILQPGAILGADGFGYAQTKEHTHYKIPQLGVVVIEDDVEVGAGACIDRGTMGATRIHRGAKIDNLVQVGHNCDVGEHSILCGQVGVAGSTVIEHHVMVGGQVGLSGHLRVGAGAQIGAQSGVHGDLPAGAKVIGSPAIEGRVFARMVAAQIKLPELLKRLRALERRAEPDDRKA